MTNPTPEQKAVALAERFGKHAKGDTEIDGRDVHLDYFEFDATELTAMLSASPAAPTQVETQKKAPGDGG